MVFLLPLSRRTKTCTLSLDKKGLLTSVGWKWWLPGRLALMLDKVHIMSNFYLSMDCDWPSLFHRSCSYCTKFILISALLLKFLDYVFDSNFILISSFTECLKVWWRCLLPVFQEFSIKAECQVQIPVVPQTCYDDVVLDTLLCHPVDSPWAAYPMGNLFSQASFVIISDIYELL